ncbi:type II toxin-antitoxin system YafQ family toxin [Rhodopila globiformis]|uniref:type II toxin-antitoxin system YafQ family toxin n=1 Tax=Rhodopila globiformis TaxID=1071 RepID=UPI001957D145|nr:type II toxin-antitoxin system YafQ family toxin [Rhodopila globiformis]
MRSPKESDGKRASPPRASDYTAAFLKDWKRLTHSGRYNMRQLKEAMMLLIANDGPLPPAWRDHAPTGNWADHRECHIGRRLPVDLPAHRRRDGRVRPGRDTRRSVRVIRRGQRRRPGHALFAAGDVEQGVIEGSGPTPPPPPHARR